MSTTKSRFAFYWLVNRSVFVLDKYKLESCIPYCVFPSCVQDTKARPKFLWLLANATGWKVDLRQSAAWWIFAGKMPQESLGSIMTRRALFDIQFRRSHSFSFDAPLVNRSARTKFFGDRLCSKFEKCWIHSLKWINGEWTGSAFTGSHGFAKVMIHYDVFQIRPFDQRLWMWLPRTLSTSVWVAA